MALAHEAVFAADAHPVDAPAETETQVDDADPPSGLGNLRGPGGSVSRDAELEALEIELARECEELERQLHNDPLAFENAALEVQLVQMQDDYSALQEDSESFRKYSNERIDDLSRQLEEQAQAACDSEGRADCLRDRLGYHVDQGELEGSYWRTQCEKRNDSICFLTLKLQEYTVPSYEYSKHREVKFFQKDPDCDEIGAGNCNSGADPQQQSPRMLGSPRQLPSPLRAWKTPRSPLGVVAPSKELRDTLEAEHQALCREVERQEEEELQRAQELQHCELTSAVLQAKRAFWDRLIAGAAPDATIVQGAATRSGTRAVPEDAIAQASDGTGEHCSSQLPQVGFGSSATSPVQSPLQLPLSSQLRSPAGAGSCPGGNASCRLAGVSGAPRAPSAPSGIPTTMPLRDRVAFLRQALAVSLDDSHLPTWTQQCTWKEDLDVRAGQLERISMQLDAMKRALDAANEELHWQAKCADDLGMGAAELWRTSKVEERKTAGIHAECMQSESAISELTERLQRQS